MSLEGRVALVTGGGRGIGRAISLALAEDGAEVAVNYHQDAEAAQQTVEAIRKGGRKAQAYRASVDSQSDCEAMVGAVVRDFGTVSILVNNGGCFVSGVRDVVDSEFAELEQLMRVNAFAAWHLAQLVLPTMREQVRGNIIMMSSLIVDTHNPGYAPYAMSKAALDVLAYTLANEERAHGVRVNIVTPGFVETDMGLAALRSTGTENFSDVAPAMPFGRVCQPEDVANAVRFLVGDTASYVSGTRLVVHGSGDY
ncbi:MAG: SDR family oxidoreductase [Chloroflexota bacterium]|nr:SDR family oxidoreductase [Chloroflexota bacterium]